MSAATWKGRINSYLPWLCCWASIVLIACTPLPAQFQNIASTSLTILGMLTLITRQPSQRPKGTKELGKLLICFTIPAIASFSHSVAITSTLKFVTLLTWSIFIGSALLCSFGNTKTRDWQRSAISTIFTIWVAASCIYATTSITIYGQFVSINPALTVFTSSLFGRILTMLMPVALWKSVKQKSTSGFALLLASGVASMLTGQRNNVLSYLIGACLLVSQMPRKVAVRWLAACVAMLILVYPFSGELNSRTARMLATVPRPTGLVSTSERTQVAKPGTNKTEEEKTIVKHLNEISSERGYIYEAALKMTIKNPITGVGAGTFRRAFELFATQKGRDHFGNKPPGPHNIYVSVIAQTGFIGIAGLLLAIILLIQWHRSSRYEAWRLEEAAPYSASLFVMLFPLITQDDLYSSFWWTMFVYMACGLLGALLLEEPGSTKGENKSQATTN